MITLFLSKNNTRTSSVDELVNVLSTNRDLIYTNGMTKIGGIYLYHFKNDDNDAEISYGAYRIVITKDRNFDWKGDQIPGAQYQIGVSTIGYRNELFYAVLLGETVKIKNKEGKHEEIPLSAFASETDFFQYTTLNLDIDNITEASIVKLITLVSEITTK